MVAIPVDWIAKGGTVVKMEEEEEKMVQRVPDASSRVDP
jgi:hypothetical protein